MLLRHWPRGPITPLPPMPPEWLARPPRDARWGDILRRDAAAPAHVDLELRLAPDGVVFFACCRACNARSEGLCPLSEPERCRSELAARQKRFAERHAGCMREPLDGGPSPDALLLAEILAGAVGEEPVWPAEGRAELYLLEKSGALYATELDLSLERMPELLAHMASIRVALGPQRPLEAAALLSLEERLCYLDIGRPDSGDADSWVETVELEEPRPVIGLADGASLRWAVARPGCPLACDPRLFGHEDVFLGLFAVTP